MKRILIILFLMIWMTGCAAKHGLYYPSERWLADKDRTLMTLPPKVEKYSELDVADKEIFKELETFMVFGQRAGYTAAFPLARTQEALNTNNFDEVADSTWFTNRLGRTDLSAAQIINGANPGPGPDMSAPLTVQGAGTTGPTPTMLVEDRRGQKFVLKFDPPERETLATGAELITSIILYAAGYNVPENYLIKINPKRLVLDAHAETRGKYGKVETLSSEKWEETIEEIWHGRRENIRAIATKIPEGKILGPFSFSGKNRHDLNDHIPHEHRRELRGYRVFSSLVNNTDSLEYDTLDTFMTLYDEQGYFLHHLFDLSPTFGGIGIWDKKYDDKGKLDTQSIAGIFTFGLHEFKKADTSADEPFLPYQGFDAARWNSTYPNLAFTYMTPRDAFWAAKILMHLSADDIAKIVEQARFSSKLLQQYVTRALIERRHKIAKQWLTKLNPLDNFSLHEDTNRVLISFDDLAVHYGLANDKDTRYRYKLRTLLGRKDLTPWMETASRKLILDGQSIEQMDRGRIYKLRLQTKRAGDEWWLPPVDLYVKKEHKGITLMGLKRQYHE